VNCGAPRIAIDPSSGAEREAREPWNEPIGVRFAATMTTSGKQTEGASQAVFATPRIDLLLACFHSVRTAIAIAAPMLCSHALPPTLVAMQLLCYGDHNNILEVIKPDPQSHDRLLPVPKDAHLQQN
jgi:hypothetical protein